VRTILIIGFAFLVNQARLRRRLVRGSLWGKYFWAKTSRLVGKLAGVYCDCVRFCAPSALTVKPVLWNSSQNSYWKPIFGSGSSEPSYYLVIILKDFSPEELRIRSMTPDLETGFSN
jgi:hypothetical protein